jgi:hypothetical protein
MEFLVKLLSPQSLLNHSPAHLMPPSKFSLSLEVVVVVKTWVVEEEAGV